MATAAVMVGRGYCSLLAPDVNRLRAQPGRAAYLTVWMNLMTPLPCPGRPKFRLTML